MEEFPMYVLSGWDEDKILKSGDSRYPKVNLRRNGLENIFNLPDDVTKENATIIDMRPSKLADITFSWWSTAYAVRDKKKFMLARLKLGI